MVQLGVQLGVDEEHLTLERALLLSKGGMPEPPISPHDNKIDLDDILPQLGQFGRYQMCVFCYLGVAIIFTSIYNCQYIFNAGSVAYRCRVPACESTPEKFVPNGWAKFALPSTGYDCWQKVPIGSTCEPKSFSNQTRRCYSWVYENHLTIVPEYDLACQEWKRTLVGTMHNVGVFIAIPSTAVISDRFGRRFALIGTAVAPALFGVIRAFCYNYYLYLVLEVFEAFVGNGTYSTAFIMALEVVGRTKRVIGGNMVHCMFAMGQVTAALVAWAIPYWRTYTLVIFAPSFLFIFYCFFVEESVRWLLAKGRRDEAIRIILKIAKYNRKTLLPETVNLLTSPSRIPRTISNNPRSTSFQEPEPPVPSLLKQVLRSKTIISRMAVVSFWWISVTMIYYGLSINSVSLMGNKYVNYILTSLVEIPGALLCFVTLDRFGRKTSIMTSFFLCGLSLLVLPATNNPILIMTLTLMGKMMISLIFCAIYIYTVELFPTQARHMLMGFCSMTGRIGSMAAPQTPLLKLYMESLPYIVFGSMAGTAGLLMLLTPETLHVKLPDTIKQAEQLNMAVRSRTSK
uniref:Major facilitator superfamily (MFS) profile domain-containing protein n=1 Tax=Heliothis virescens TaxID=7102 RepID=A0A2A4K5P1_HELVI